MFDTSGLGLVTFAPTWFLSALFLSMFIILPLLLYYGKVYSQIIAPVSALLILDWV